MQTFLCSGPESITVNAFFVVDDYEPYNKILITSFARFVLENNLPSVFRTNLASLGLYNERPRAKYSPGQTSHSVIKMLLIYLSAYVAVRAQVSVAMYLLEKSFQIIHVTVWDTISPKTSNWENVHKSLNKKRLMRTW